MSLCISKPNMLMSSELRLLLLEFSPKEKIREVVKDLPQRFKGFLDNGDALQLTTLTKAHKPVQCPLCIHHGQAGLALTPPVAQHTLSWCPPGRSTSVFHVLNGSLWKKVPRMVVERANKLLPTLSPTLHPSKVCAGEQSCEDMQMGFFFCGASKNPIVQNLSLSA